MYQLQHTNSTMYDHKKWTQNLKHHANIQVLNFLLNKLILWLIASKNVDIIHYHYIIISGISRYVDARDKHLQWLPLTAITNCKKITIRHWISFCNNNLKLLNIGNQSFHLKYLCYLPFCCPLALVPRAAAPLAPV